MQLRLIQGGLAHAASSPPPMEPPRLSGEFVRRPDWPPPPQELDSSLGKVTLAVVGVALLLLAML